MNLDGGCIAYIYALEVRGRSTSIKVSSSTRSGQIMPTSRGDAVYCRSASYDGALLSRTILARSLSVVSNLQMIALLRVMASRRIIKGRQRF